MATKQDIVDALVQQTEKRHTAKLREIVKLVFDEDEPRADEKLKPILECLSD